MKRSAFLKSLFTIAVAPSVLKDVAVSIDKPGIVSKSFTITLEKSWMDEQHATFLRQWMRDFERTIWLGNPITNNSIINNESGKE